MKKQAFYFVAALALAIPQSVKAYDFSAVAPTGQTLYYNIVGSNVEVTSELNQSPFYNTFPTGNLEIPSSVSHNGTTYPVTTIGTYAFWFCVELLSVIIHDPVDSIGNWAFVGCANLKTVSIPNSTTVIGSYAFSDCDGLTTVAIGDSVTSIGTAAFSCCRNLAEIYLPNTLTSIGINAFGFCSALVSVTIPNSISTIPPYAFNFCEGLVSVTIPNSVTTIEEGAFSNCANLPSLTIPNSVTSIGRNAFVCCSTLTSITIPNSVTMIGDGAFAACTNVASIEVDSGNVVYDSRENCNAIITTETNELIAGCKNTIIPNSVTTIGSRAFHGCIGLTSVTIPDSVTTICYSAFDGCCNLTSLTIPNSVATIGVTAFANCTGLTEITSLRENAPAWGSNYYSLHPFYKVPSTIPVNISCGSKPSYRSEWTYFHNFIEPLLYATEVKAFNEATGTVEIMSLNDCRTIFIEAIAVPGYRFVQWHDGNRENPRKVILTKDTSFTAWFESTMQGISAIDPADVTVYSTEGRIVVRGAEGMVMQVFDIVGREVIHRTRDGETPILPGGVYVVKIGSLPARKVVVIR